MPYTDYYELEASMDQDFHNNYCGYCHCLQVRGVPYSNSSVNPKKVPDSG